MSYAELHCKTNFSFLEGASHPDELVVRAAELGYAALAITDRNSLAGVVRAHSVAKEVGLKLLIGAEITLYDAPPVVLLATDRASYGRLSRLITCGRRRADKGECQIGFDDLAEHAAGLLAAVICTPNRAEPIPAKMPAAPSLGATAASVSSSGLIPAQAVWSEPRGLRLHTDSSAGLAAELLAKRDRLGDYRDLFGDRCYAIASRHLGPDDARHALHVAERVRRAGVPLVAAGDVHYHSPQRRPLHDVLVAVRSGCTVAEARDRLFANGERHLKSPVDMAALFADDPQAVRRSLEVAERCRFSLDELRYEYPEELAPAGKTPHEHLTDLAYRGAHKRYPDGIPEKVQGLLKHELELIAELRYEAYFLTVQDLVRFARSRGILCQGRGSAANSVVCYCLGVTAVSPERLDVLFERFISRERNEAPDIDVDFEHERREEVLQYLYDKYGRERAGMTAEVISYRTRSAVRDVGKALGLSLDRIDALTKTMDVYGGLSKLEDRCRMAGLDPQTPVVRQMILLVSELVGFPRHLSQHVGGMVMTRGPLCELVPIENASMADRTVIQWNKDDLDELGILKVDCLALGMLTAIRKCFDLVRNHHGRQLTLATVPQEDPRVYAMICRADTMGVFQIESRAQMSMLPRLRPQTFYDLVIEVAIVRPGPIQGDMVHPYLRRRAGDEVATYPNDEVRQVLEKTLGVPLFQEQAMRLAVVAAGFTPGEADQLRRAMGAWRRPGVIDAFHQKLVEGMLARGFDASFAEHIFNQIRGFGQYGFPESHAASFALLVYVSSWLKCYYPDAFCAALLNSQPMGFYAPAQLIRNAIDHRVTVLPVDVGASQWDCTLEPAPVDPGKAGGSRRKSPSSRPACWAVRLGFRQVRGLPERVVRVIEKTREAGPFRSLVDFTMRTRLSQAMVSRLAAADAFRSLAMDRRGSLWQALSQERGKQPQPLFDELRDDDALTALPPMTAQEEVFADYQTAGLSLKGHPMAFYREQMNALGIAPAAQLATMADGRPIRVAGLVLVRQRPGTAKGITFVTLEDETGTSNLIIRVDVWERFYKVARTASALIAHGRLQRQKGVIHVLVTKLENLAGRVGEMKSVSRDFH